MFKMFGKYDEAKKEAEESNQPLWDTRQLPERYGVGETTIEIEEDEDNQDWELIDQPTTAQRTPQRPPTGKESPTAILIMKFQRLGEAQVE